MPPVAADPVRLGHALDNLLDNALTYTDRGGRITLSAGMLDERKVRLSVADTGVGIPAEHLPHVFEKFFRVPDQSRGTAPAWAWRSSARSCWPTAARSPARASSGEGTVFPLTLPIWNPRVSDAS